MDARSLGGRFRVSPFSVKKGRPGKVVKKATPGTIIVASTESPGFIRKLMDNGAQELLRAGTRHLYKGKGAYIGDPKLVVLRR